MASEAKLLRHHPGTVTSIEIPICNGSFGEISFKSIVNALVAKSKTEEALTSAASSTSAATLSQIPKLKEVKHRSNSYDNIIEKLERKYTSHMIIGDEEGSEEDEETDERGDEVGETNAKTTKKKRKSNLYDAYDLNDPFVDDSDEIAQVTAELKKRKLRTVHGGFFVSSGELEVEKDTETQSKKTVASNQIANVPNKNATHSASASSAMVTSDKMQKILEKGLNQKGPVTGHTGDIGDEAPILIPDGAIKADVEGGIKIPRVRVVRPKPLWVPSPAALSALETFREAYRSGTVTIGKNGLIPQQLEPLLSALDRAVRTAHNDTLHTTSGFEESVVEILGGDASTAKVKNVLAKLRHKELSAELKLLKDGLSKQLLVLIKENTLAIVEGVKSSDPDPSASLSPTLDQTTRPTATAHAGPNTTPTTPTRTDKDKDKDKDSGLTQSNASMQTPAKVQDPTHTSDSTPVPTPVPTPAPTSPSAAVPLKEYDWQVRWSLPMKIMLCEFSVSITKWVSGENSYRTRITAHEKRSLDETEYEELVEKDEMALAMKGLLAGYPPSCRNADISSLKKMITMEKQRVKKKIAKLLAAQTVSTSVVLMSVDTTAHAAPTSSSSSAPSVPQPLPPSTTPSSASTLSKSLPAPLPVPAQKKIINSSGNVNSPKKNQPPIITKNKETKQKVVKSHKKLTKKSKSILATNKMLAKALNLKKPKKNKFPVQAKIATETVPVTVPVVVSVPVQVPELVRGTGTGAVGTGTGKGKGVDQSVRGDFLIHNIGGAEQGPELGPEVLPSSAVTVPIGNASPVRHTQTTALLAENITDAVKDVTIGEGVGAGQGVGVGNTQVKQKKIKVKKITVISNVLKDKETTKKMSPKMSAAVLAVKRFNSVTAYEAGSLPPPLPISHPVALDSDLSETLQLYTSTLTPASTATATATATIGISASIDKAITAHKGIVITGGTGTEKHTSITGAAGADTVTGTSTLSATSIIISSNPPLSTSVAQAVDPSLPPSLIPYTGTSIGTLIHPHTPASTSTVTASTAAVSTKRVRLSKSQTAAAKAGSEGSAERSEGKKKRRASHTEVCVGTNAVTAAALQPAAVAVGGVVDLSSAVLDLSSAPRDPLPFSCTNDSEKGVGAGTGIGAETETLAKGSTVSTPAPTPGESPDTSVGLTGGATTPMTSSAGSNRGGRRSSTTARRDSESAEDTVISSAEVTDDETPERGDFFTIPPSFNFSDFTLL